MKNSVGTILSVAVLGGLVYYFFKSGAAEKTKETVSKASHDVSEKAKHAFESGKEAVEENVTSKLADFAIEHKDTVLKFAGILLPVVLKKVFSGK